MTSYFGWGAVFERKKIDVLTQKKLCVFDRSCPTNISARSIKSTWLLLRYFVTVVHLHRVHLLLHILVSFVCIQRREMWWEKSPTKSTREYFREQRAVFAVVDRNVQEAAHVLKKTYKSLSIYATTRSKKKVTKQIHLSRMRKRVDVLPRKKACGKSEQPELLSE